MRMAFRPRGPKTAHHLWDRRVIVAHRERRRPAIRIGLIHQCPGLILPEFLPCNNNNNININTPQHCAPAHVRQCHPRRPYFESTQWPPLPSAASTVSDIDLFCSGRSSCRCTADIRGTSCSKCIIEDARERTGTHQRAFSGPRCGARTERRDRTPVRDDRPRFGSTSSPVSRRSAASRRRAQTACE